MVTMANRDSITFVVFMLLTAVRCQKYVGDLCTLKSGGPGICKLFNDCQKAREDLENSRKFPQTCGFDKESQPIVCCPQRIPGQISYIKCREYSQYVNETIPSPLLRINSTTLTKRVCKFEVVKLIIGGELAANREFPHMAVIGYKTPSGEVTWGCGGSIISEQYILTAAHCLSSMESFAEFVRIGITDLSKRGNRQQFNVAERIPHPDYNYPSHYNDIALIKLDRPAKMNSYARPACLYTKPTLSSERAIATGWGATTNASKSNELLKVTLNLIDHETCNITHAPVISRKLINGILNNLQVCAGAQEEKNTCQGDSGGPLQIYHIGDSIDCMYDIIGVTSFGHNCPSSIGVYARTSNYIQWIEDTIWPS